MGYDGWVVVGTKLDTKQLEKDLKASKQKLREYEREAEKLSTAKAKAEIDLKPYEEEKKLLRERTQEDLRLTKNSAQKAVFLKIEQKGIERINNKYASQISNLEQINQKIAENAKNQSIVSEEIKETNSQLEKARFFKNFNEGAEDAGKKIKNILKSTARWAIAIFGIRSAYMFVRNAMSTLSQYNEQLATDLEYIRFALASMLQPLIEKLIQLTYKLLSYINYIAQAWFGIDLFANASADAMKRGAGSAEKMKKSLAGFDEMNVLNDNGTTGAMGGMPSVDLSMEDADVPSWIKWIADNKDVLISGLLGIAGALIAVHFGASLLLGLGIGVAIAGITYAIVNLIKFLQDPTFNNFINIITGIGIAIVGVGIIISSLPVVIAGAVIAIVALIVKNYEFIMGLFNKAITWIENDFVKSLRGIFGPLGDIIASPIIFAINYLKGAFQGLFGGIREVVNGIVKIFKGDFKNGITSVFNGLKSIMLAPINALISGINSLIRGVNKIKIDIPSWLPGIGGKKLGFNIPQIPKLAVGGIVNMPGKGVPVGGAIAGEVSKEGVIPLTNSQAMQELGQTIGRYITINANITNTMNGRVISRELQKINTNSDFATNR